MAKTIQNPILVIRAVTSVCGWKVVEYQESNTEDGSPHAAILVRVFQDAERPYGDYWLRAASEGNSLCLFVNPDPSSMDDQLLTGHRGLTDAFATLSAAYHEAGGGSDDRLEAIENVLVSTGLLDLAFA
jgi:hypothetical protein